MFAVGNVTANMGMAIGSLGAMLVVDTSRPATFMALYVLDAASFLAASCLVLRVRLPEESTPAAGRFALEPAVRVRGQPRSGYLVVLRDRVVVGAGLLALVLATAGFAQFHTTIPVLATRAGLTASDLGLMQAANTIAVVVLQLIVLRVLAGRRRTRALVALGVVWSGGWLLVLAAGLVADRATVLGLFITFQVVFALGETLMWPTLPAVVNDVAPESLRGRYNGAFTLALTTGMVLGPLLSGFTLGHGWAIPLLVVMVAACAGSVAAALLLERILPLMANLVPARNTDRPPPQPHGR
jgi:hypothetical protein